MTYVLVSNVDGGAAKLDRTPHWTRWGVLSGCALKTPPTVSNKASGGHHGAKGVGCFQMEKSGAKVDIDKTRDPCIVRFTGTKACKQHAVLT
eukprot:1100106-Amphidinium_carterae.1